MGLRALLKEAFLFEPSPNAVIPSPGAKASIVFPEDRTAKRGASRTRLLSAQGGTSAADARLGLSGDARRRRNYESYLNAITVGAVFKACSTIAATIASCDFRVLDDDDTPVEIKEDLPGLHALLRRPNPQTTGFNFLEFLTYDLLLTGNAIVALDSWNARGEPTEMFRLRPDLVFAIRLPSGDVKYGYDLTPSTMGGQGDTIFYDEQELLHFKFSNPRDQFWGLGPVEASELAISCDKRIGEFKLNYFDRGAILDGVLTTDGDMDDTEYDRLLTKWHAAKDGGGRGRFKTAILWQGAEYTPIQEPLGSVPIVEISKMSRNDILEAFGVPAAKIDLEGVNFNNSRSADQFYWAETITPMLRRMEPGWDILLTHFGAYHAAYQEREIVDFKTRAETAFALSQTGAFTRNDVRVAAGYDPLPADDPLGDVFLGSTRQALFPGEYDEPLDYLPMTPGRLLGVEEPAVRAQHEAIAKGLPAPGQPFTPGGAQGATSADGPKPASGSTPPSQQNRRARATPPASRTRSGVGRSSTGRKSLPAYPEGLLSAEAKRRLAQAERDAVQEPEQEPGQQGHVPRLNPYLVVDAEMQEQHDDGAS